MTNHEDLDGLQGIKGLKLNGATQWIGVSSNIAAMDSTAGAANTLSVTNHSINNQLGVLDATSSTAATVATNLNTLINKLALAGVITVTYDGT